MSMETFKPYNEVPEVKACPLENNEQALFRDAQKKIEILDSFLATGDIISDYNYFLEITNRRINYKRATTESKEDLVKNLEKILNSLEEELKEKSANNYESEALKTYYQKIPQAEIKVLTELLDFYK